MTGGYKTEITGIVLDECQWSEKNFRPWSSDETVT